MRNLHRRWLPGFALMLVFVLSNACDSDSDIESNVEETPESEVTENQQELEVETMEQVGLQFLAAVASGDLTAAEAYLPTQDTIDDFCSTYFDENETCILERLTAYLERISQVIDDFPTHLPDGFVPAEAAPATDVEAVTVGTGETAIEVATGVVEIADAAGVGCVWCSIEVIRLGDMTYVVPRLREIRTEEATDGVRELYDSAMPYYAPPEGSNAVPTPPVPGNFGDADWGQMNFQMSDSHYFAYEYDGSTTGLVEVSFTASAFGNLDTDEMSSTFFRAGTAPVQP